MAARALRAAAVAVAVAAAAVAAAGGAAPKVFSYRTVRELEHSTSAFTEGLVFREWDGKLVESTGLRGGSKIILYSIDDEGISVDKEVMLPGRDFGEGIEFFDGKLYSLTWKNRRMHVFDRHSLEPVDAFDFDVGIYEGWGLTVSPDRSALITGDGSEMLHRIDVRGHRLEITEHLAVRDCANGMPRVRGINELELVPRILSHPEQVQEHRVDRPPAFYENLRGGGGGGGGSDEPSTSASASSGLSSDLIWGNIISTMCVAMIDPDSGNVEGWLLLDDIYDKVDMFNKVANGIAYRAIDGTLWVTGKDWAKLFQIELVEHPDPGSVSIAKSCTSHWNLGYSPVKSPGNSNGADRCGDDAS